MDTARQVGVESSGGEDFVSKAGSYIRRAGERLDSSPMMHRQQFRAIRGVPTDLRRAGDYLERRRMRGVKLDAERAIVARPVVAVLLAAAIGWLAGRTIRS